VSASAKMITDAAVSKSYAKSKRIEWIDIEIGEAAEKRYGNGITESAKKMLTEYRVLLKGPLTTPVGSGSRSFNVAIRMLLDLYANIRPVRYIKGIESPIKRPV
jgi:Isocitrate dehydrogenases